MIDINLERIQRLLIINNIKNNYVKYSDYLSTYYLKTNESRDHFFPGYNQNFLENQKLFFEKLFDIECTAVLPLMSKSNEFQNKFKIFERPNLYTINLKNKLDILWGNIRKKRQSSIDSNLNLLRFGIAEQNSPLVDTFIKLYLTLQVKRSTPLINFFDAISLDEMIKSPGFHLFYAINTYASSSILFHLVRVIDDKLVYFFSANTDDQSRSYSAFLHWNIIQHSKKEFSNCSIYDLGGGIDKDDGIERFKREIGGVKHARWYYFYPKIDYIDGVFFPKHASFLNARNFHIH